MGVSAAIFFKAPQAVVAAVSTIGPEFNNLHPDVQARAMRVLEEANLEFKPDGFKVGIYEGWRTLDKQRQHKESGASQVADLRDSYHVWGLAVDFVFIDRFGRWSWLPDPGNPNNKGYRDPRWYRLGEIIKRHGFQWGGDWQWFDGPHAQLTLSNLAELKSRYADPLDYVSTFA